MRHDRSNRTVAWLSLEAIVAVIGLTSIVLSVIVLVRQPPMTANSAGIEYKDLVAIVLSALGVMIAMLAAGIGVLTIWGFRTFRDELQGAVEKAVASAEERGAWAASRTAVADVKLDEGAEGYGAAAATEKST